MCGLDGIVYANTVDGNSNALTFLNFFEEAASVYLPDGTPAYSYGDHVVFDNAPIHHQFIYVFTNCRGNASRKCTHCLVMPRGMTIGTQRLGIWNCTGQIEL